MAKKKKKRGHYCKICHKHKPKERFNSKGYKKHICKACEKNLRKKAKNRRLEQERLETSFSSSQEPEYFQDNYTLFEQDDMLLLLEDDDISKVKWSIYKG